MSWRPFRNTAVSANRCGRPPWPWPRSEPAERYRLALRAAEAACRLEPGNGLYLNTLGVAQYRTGRCSEALATLRQSEVLNAKQLGRPDPAGLAFLAMTHFRLGDKHQAAAVLERLRERMKAPEWANNAESQACLQEAEALIEGKPDQAKMPYADP